MILNKLFFLFNRNGQDNASDNDNLKYELKQTKENLDLALHNLDNVTDPDLIDCCIYEMQAAQLRYKFLLREVKRSEMIPVAAHVSLSTVSTIE